MATRFRQDFLDTKNSGNRKKKKKNRKKKEKKKKMDPKTNKKIILFNHLNKKLEAKQKK